MILTKSKFLLIIYVTSAFMINRLLFGDFFRDSSWYLQVSYSPDTAHRLLLQFFPGYHIVAAIVSLLLIIRLLIRSTTPYYYCFIHPYSLLLLSSPMKEQLVGLAALVIANVRISDNRYSQSSRTLKNLFGLLMLIPMLSIRKIYLPIIFVVLFRPVVRFQVFTLVWLILVVPAGVLLIDFAQIYSVLQERAFTGHTGREYFSGLCVDQKSSFVSLIPCWLLTVVGIPFHSDVLTPNYVIFLSFHAAWIFLARQLKYEPLQKALTIFGFALALHFLVFWWGPTLGAATRYYLPVFWLLSAFLVRKPYTQLHFSAK